MADDCERTVADARGEMSDNAADEERQGRLTILDRKVAAFLVSQRRWSRHASALVVAAMLIASWLLTYVPGGTSHMPTSWFYIPIILAGARFGLAGGAVAAIASGILTGPLMPADAAAGTSQSIGTWGIRAVAFLVIGLPIASTVRALIRAMSRERDLTQRELEFAARKAAVIATVSHEFRTPLTIIEVTSKRLAAGSDVEEGQRQMIEGLQRAATRLDNLVDTVVATAEGLEGLREPSRLPVDLEEICRAVIGELEDLDAPARVHLRVSRSAPGISTDPQILHVILRHVIENALKFSPSDDPVLVWTKRDENELLIVVRDRGPGIPQDFVDRAGAFVQVDQSTTREHGGLGIGLFAVHTLISRLGGRFETRPHRGRGTIAVLRLPARAKVAGRALAHAR